jgi:hypothetical protein
MKAQQEERARLRSRDTELRAAIGASLRDGQPQLAVALDTTRDFLEMVLAEEDPTPSRLAVARARVDIALSVWRRMRDRLRLEPSASAG